MIIKSLQLTTKPALFEPGTAFMWTDPHISRQLLEVHLNPDVDLASRKPATITKTIEWILSRCPKGPLRVLDLGCGPGLYTEQLARLGHRVTGIDISKNSLEYANRSAQGKGLDITYHNRSYLELDYLTETYDLVMMIFTDMGVLAPTEREELLSAIAKVMAPGGSFMFDVLSTQAMGEALFPRRWEYAQGGFWRPGPYLLLSEALPYESHRTVLNRHVVLDETDTPATYHFWVQFFVEEELTAMLARHGFQETTVHSDVLPPGGPFQGKNVLFTHTRKP